MGLLILASFIFQSFSQDLFNEFISSGAIGFIFAALLGAIIVAHIVPEKRKKLQGVLIPIFIYFCLTLLALLLTLNSKPIYSSYAQALATAFVSVSLLNLGSLMLFDVILAGLRLKVPRLLRDTTVILTYVVVILVILSSRGVNVTGLITTSAIISAVIGLSLQDTLGNIIAGFALEIEHVIKPGDWIKVEPYIGRVKEVRWRQTVIETRNWDTVLIPNSQLMKSQVMIYGQRQDQPLQTRRWVYFNVDFRYTPNEVIGCINDVLQANPIPNVAADPKIHAILMDFKDSYCTYAVRYWLTDLAVDDPTDSNVRIRIYYALKRANIPLSIPAHSLFMTELSNKREIRKHEEEIEQHITALRSIELFHHLKEEELKELSGHIRYAPFTNGEVITRQGAEAHWLYIIVKGKVSVRVSVSADDGTNLVLEKEVSQLKSGDFFGEMSLMTGAPRASTVIALGEVECYRLDKEAFQNILTARPEIADEIALIMARRRMKLESIVKGLDQEIHHEEVAKTQSDILKSIKEFFGL